MAESLLSEEARRILATPLAARLVMLSTCSEQVRDEVAMECHRFLNERFPEKRELSDLLAKLALHG